MGLTYAGRPQEDHIALLLDKVQIKKGHHFLTVQLGLKGKVELVNALDKGKPRYLQGCLHPTLFPAANLLFQKCIQKG